MSYTHAFNCKFTRSLHWNECINLIWKHHAVYILLVLRAYSVDMSNDMFAVRVKVFQYVPTADMAILCESRNRYRIPFSPLCHHHHYEINYAESLSVNWWTKLHVFDKLTNEHIYGEYHPPHHSHTSDHMAFHRSARGTLFEMNKSTNCGTRASYGWKYF